MSRAPACDSVRMRLRPHAADRDPVSSSPGWAGNTAMAHRKPPRASAIIRP